MLFTEEVNNDKSIIKMDKIFFVFTDAISYVIHAVMGFQLSQAEWII